MMQESQETQDSHASKAKPGHGRTAGSVRITQ